MSHIDPLFKVLASLLDSYDVQMSLIEAVDPGNLRTMAIASLKRTISQDLKKIDILEETLLIQIQNEANKSFEFVALVAEASKDEEKRTLTDLRASLAQKCLEQEMTLEAKFITTKLYLLGVQSAVEKM